MKVTDKMFAYIWRGRGNNCNSYLYSGEKVILVDPGHIHNEFNENCLERLLSEMDADGINAEDIDQIFCTHGHPDHCEAASLLNEKFNIPVAMHEKEESHMEMLAQFFEQMTGKRPSLPQIDIYLQEGELELGDGKEIIEIIHTPGHSPGSLSFYFPQERVLVSGDAVFQGSIGRTDFPEGSMEVLGESVQKLSGIEGVEWLLPGHMQPVKGEEAVKNNYKMINSLFFF